MVDLPLLSAPSLKQQMAGHRSANMTLEQLETLSDEQKAKMVLVVQDPFTSYYDAQVVADFIRLVEALGYQPVLLPFSPNGKAQHIKGFLTRFARTAQKTAGLPQSRGAAWHAAGRRRSGAGALLPR
ncbi:putative oxidase [Klebsiella variicola]|nr:putative oxidase [Klebsiella variicola]